MKDAYLTRLCDSLAATLNFPAGIEELHGAPGNPWRLPIVDVYRSRGPIQSEIEMLVLMWALVVMLKPQLVLETGTDSGVMARALGQACQANGFGRVVSAETNGDLVESARKLCAGLPVSIHHGPALDLPIRRADLLYLDSSYESRLEELARVRRGAVAVVHDTAREVDFGQQARDMCRRHIQVVTPRGFTIIQKP